MMNGLRAALIGCATLMSWGCSGGSSTPGSKDASAASQGGAGNASGAMPKDPAKATKVEVDRFGASGMLMARAAGSGLPEPNQPIDFDQPPFITQGLGPQGGAVRYYNFDVQPRTPAPIYVLFARGASDPIAGQLNIIDVIPGDTGYNDFWQIHKVTVPAGYVANTWTSFADLSDAGAAVEATQMIVNCPVVPDGSTASLRLGGGDTGLQSGWYKGKLVKYFSFEEKALSGAEVPISPIYVTFNVNPDQPNGGPASGFKSESDGVQTHNVVETLPSDAGYSPLWSVQAYDNADFGMVSDLTSASHANILGTNVATVNCPIVEIQ